MCAVSQLLPYTDLKAWSVRLFLTVFLTMLGCRHAEETLDADRAAIEALLAEQVVAWNAGDTERFMEGYWESDSLRFASGGTVQRGWQETLARYRRVYPDKETMGKLTFTLIEVRTLSSEWATVFGRYYLEREPAIGDATGLFTLMFRKLPEGWRIVSDHTSAAN